MVRSFVLFTALLTTAATPALAQRAAQGQQGYQGYQQSQGTPDDQRACRNDATRFCRQVLGDDFAVLNCFQQNRAKLSRSCQGVLQKYGQ